MRGLTNERLEKLCSLPPPGANQPQEYEPEDEAWAAFAAARWPARLFEPHEDGVLGAAFLATGSDAV